MPDILEYLRSFRPVERFQMCSPEKAAEVIYPKSTDSVDEKFHSAVELGLLNLYHRKYRVGSAPTIWPPEFREEIENTPGGGTGPHEQLKYEATWLGNVHWGCQAVEFEDYYVESSEYRYDVKLDANSYAEVGNLPISSRSKVYEVFDLRDAGRYSKRAGWVRTGHYGETVSRLLVIPYPDRTGAVHTGQELDIYLIKRGPNYDRVSTAE